MNSDVLNEIIQFLYLHELNQLCSTNYIFYNFCKNDTRLTNKLNKVKSNVDKTINEGSLELNIDFNVVYQIANYLNIKIDDTVIIQLFRDKSLKKLTITKRKKDYAFFMKDISGSGFILFMGEETLKIFLKHLIYDMSL